jgi:ATP-dependent helicase/DNAse subunit B
MEDREMPQMHKYGERINYRIMMATVRHVTVGSGLRKFQAASNQYINIISLNQTIMCTI